MQKPSLEELASDNVSANMVNLLLQFLLPCKRERSVTQEVEAVLHLRRRRLHLLLALVQAELRLGPRGQPRLQR